MSLHQVSDTKGPDVGISLAAFHPHTTCSLTFFNDVALDFGATIVSRGVPLNGDGVACDLEEVDW